MQRTTQRTGGALAARMNRRKWSYFMLIPVAIYFVLFKYLPMGGLVIAFKDYRILKGIWASPWVGLENFGTFINGRMFWTVIRNTLVLNLYSLLFTFPAPILFALMLNEIGAPRVKRVIQTVTYMPHFISTVVLVSMISELFSPTGGIVNQLLEKLGTQSVYFMGRPQYFRSLYIGSGLWSGLGWGSIIYLAAITAIDPTYYEAATIDGASRFQKIRHVTIPCIQSTVVIMLILRIGALMNTDFEKILLMQSSGNKSVSQVLSTYIYERGIRNNEFGYSTSVGFFNSVISLALVASANALSRRLCETTLW